MIDKYKHLFSSPRELIDHGKAEIYNADGVVVFTSPILVVDTGSSTRMWVLLNSPFASYDNEACFRVVDEYPFDLGESHVRGFPTHSNKVCTSESVLEDIAKVRGQVVWVRLDLGNMKIIRAGETKAKANHVHGCSCITCGLFSYMSAPNLPDGTFKCYSCRENPFRTYY